MNSQHRQQIDYFVSMTCASKKVAQKFLVKSKWNIQNAINMFYDEGSPALQPQQNENIPEVQAFFAQNCVIQNKQKILNEQGLEKLFSKMLNIDMQNTVLGHIMINVMEMKKAGEATKQNLYNLFKYTDTRSFSEFRKKIPELAKELKTSKDLHKAMFLGFFDFYSVTKSPTLDFQIAVQIWDIYLKDIMMNHDLFIKYLQQKQPKPVKIHRDTWKLVYQFAMNVQKIQEVKQEDGWPILIDEFLEYLKKNKNMQ